jgi:hypothetical protein
MIKRAPIELPPEIARGYFEDLRAYHREKNPIKADEIAARQLHALHQYQRPREKKLRLSDVQDLFQKMKKSMTGAAEHTIPRH